MENFKGDAVHQAAVRVSALPDEDARKSLVGELPEGVSDQILQRLDSLNRFLAARGVRYRDCDFANYEAKTAKQRTALRRAQDYAVNFPEHQAGGRGLFVFGPVGTGKDHLLTAVAKAVIKLWGTSVALVSGPGLASEMRDAITRGVTESSIVREYLEPELLIISDLTPPTGKLSDYQTNVLYQIIDGRYNRNRPTCVTVNVTDGDEARSKLGDAIVDRLRDGAVAIFCEWASHRRPHE